jgi:hypothetical protein
MKQNTIRLEIKDGPVITLRKEGFYYNAKLIKDEGAIYELFKTWLLLAHKVDKIIPIKLEDLK